MKAEQLIALCNVAKYKNITKTAEALKTSQPGLSRHLAALQESVGQILYERNAYGIELTPAGEALLPYACAVAQTLSQARDFSKHGAQAQIQLRVGLSHSLVPSLTPKLLNRVQELKTQMPHLELDLYESYSEMLIEQVLLRQLDVCFIVQPFKQPPESLTSTIFSSNLIGFFVKADDSLAEQVYSSISMLDGQVVIVCNAVSAVHKRVLDSLERHHIVPSDIIEVSGPAAVLACVKQGLGIGIGLSSYLHYLSVTEEFKFIQLEEPGFNIASLRVNHELETVELSKRAAIEFISGFS